MTARVMIIDKIIDGTEVKVSLIVVCTVNGTNDGDVALSRWSNSVILV
jgi:hypothetical protein